jgi:small subunit ribosomal protein S6
MNYYETLYIVHPSLESGRLKDIILSVEESLKKIGGSPLAMELWGKRKLAYFIDKQRYGTYVLLHYNGEGKCTGEFAVELEQNPNILAYLTTSIEKENVLEQAEDLDTQIAGKTRESQRTESSSEPTKTTETEPTEVTTQENDTIDATADEVTSEGGAEVENEEESVEVGEAKADEEPLEATENESDKKDTADDEVSPEEDIESKQENADETAAVSEEE